MASYLEFKLYKSVAELPAEWEAIAHRNIFLSPDYLRVLELAAPDNMECHFIGLFTNNRLCGVALAQHINLKGVNTFAKSKKAFSIKEYLFSRFSSHVIFIGNNTLTGQNAYVLDETVNETAAIATFKTALEQLQKGYKKNGIRINLLGIKDFNAPELPDYKAAGFDGYYKFCTQPNMIFSISDHWKSIDDYLAAMNTKYRTQYNRARKKAEGIEKRKLSVQEIDKYQDRIHQLYLTVAGNASFNTFHLPLNHFKVFKEQLKDHFLFYGYFSNGELIGFSTLIKNGHDMDTYFLGYDAAVQKEKMLYLNMLYDMVGYAIKKQFKHVIFARSAMEIKSSVGAVPEQVYGLVKHTNPFLNPYMDKLFAYFDPKIEWKERSPFK